MARETDESPRSFGHFFGMLDDEQAQATASRELHDLLKVLREEAVARHGTVKGTLTLKIDLKCDELEQVEATYAIDTKEPKRKSSKSLYWLDRKGFLTVENPRQQVLPLREVSAQGAALRNVENDRPAVKEI